MDSPVRRKWLFITFLLIMALLISWSAFWLTGALHGSLTPETFTAEAVTWEMERPSEYIRIDEFVNSSYTNNTISTDLAVHIVNYYENDPVWDGFDNFDSRVLVNVSVSEGFVESLFVSFTGLDEHAALDIHQDMDNIDIVNLKVSRIVDWSGVFGRNASIETKSIGQPRNVYLIFPFSWLFKDQHNTDHQLTVTLGATIFNGTAYQRIEMPIQMRAHAMTSIVTIS